MLNARLDENRCSAKHWRFKWSPQNPIYTFFTLLDKLQRNIRRSNFEVQNLKSGMQFTKQCLHWKNLNSRSQNLPVGVLTSEMEGWTTYKVAQSMVEGAWSKLGRHQFSETERD